MRNELAVPAEILNAAEQLARQLGLSPSELFTAAISDFIQRHQQVDVTAELDKIYSGTQSALDPVLDAMQLRSLPKEEW